MNFLEFQEKLKAQLEKPLPGIEAQLKLTSLRYRKRPDFQHNGDNPRESSIMILLFPDGDEIKTLLIQRPKYEGVHSGQVSFPGGKKEEGDKDQEATALRECYEEVGVESGKVKIIGKLTPLFIPPSNFLVSPFIGILDHKPVTVLDPKEVETVFEASLSELSNPANLQEKPVQVHNWNAEVPCYVIGPHIIWGATAMIISEFLEVLKEMKDYST